MALHVVVLAAGKGTRMKSARPKVLHQIAGRPIIEHVLRTVDQLNAATTVLVIGHGGDEVRGALASRPALQFAVQSPQLGTGHALLQAEPALSGESGTVLLLYADVPLLQAGTLQRLLEIASRPREPPRPCSRPSSPIRTATAASCATPTGRIARIVEERDASGDERAHPRDQQRHLRVSISRRCSRRCTASPPTTRRASTT